MTLFIDLMKVMATFSHFRDRNLEAENQVTLEVVTVSPTVTRRCETAAHGFERSVARLPLRLLTVTLFRP